MRTHKIGITNILTALVTKVLDDQVYYPCIYSLNGKHVVNQEGEFTTKFPISRIREAIWNLPNSVNYLEYLNNSLTEAYKLNKVITLGCHDNESVNFLSKKYDPEVLTTCIFYKENEYDQILKHLAEFHMFKLNNGIIPTYNDRKLIKELSYHELIEYYINAFDKQNLIPKYTEPVCQYNIQFSDMFNRDYVIKFFNSMNMSLTDSSLKFYESWLAANSDL